MNNSINSGKLITDLEQFARVRFQVASYLNQIARTLAKSEVEAENNSGKLGLEREILDLETASQNFQQGVFRLLVLGDMKRGKSTFLNALIGENILPSDVNPCTALLTVLRYGAEKQVTVYFNDGTNPEKLDFETFKRRYTIDPAEAKRWEQRKKAAFPNVDRAVIEYPLVLLKQGIEVIDSPGLNDTEARNETALNYINNCQVILFVLSAAQPWTLAERRYLENYLKGRGRTVFFLINAWDSIPESLLDPDDLPAVQAAEEKVRQVFRANLGEYCQIEGEDIYAERVFEISAIKALRRRMKSADFSLDGTGFPRLLAALDRLLVQSRAIAELRQARTIAGQAYYRVAEAIARRLPLLEQDVSQLKAKINSVAPEFEELQAIRDRFQAEIRTVRDLKAKAIADSFSAYILTLTNTFEADFAPYQPKLNFLDFLDKRQRQAFEAALQQAFEHYLNDRLAAWTLTAEKEMDAAFVQLSQSAANYGADYAQVTHKITEKLAGRQVISPEVDADEDNHPTWTRWAMGLMSLASGNIAFVLLAESGFDWKNLLFNLVAVLGFGRLITVISGFVIGPVGLALLSFGVGAVQADLAGKELVKVAKAELAKHLPQIAREQWQLINDEVKACFDNYEQEVTLRVNDDIQARQAEIELLINQKERHEVNRDRELARLQKLEQEVLVEWQNVEAVYHDFLAIWQEKEA